MDITDPPYFISVSEGLSYREDFYLNTPEYPLYFRNPQKGYIFAMGFKLLDIQNIWNGLQLSSRPEFELVEIKAKAQTALLVITDSGNIASLNCEIAEKLPKIDVVIQQMMKQYTAVRTETYFHFPLRRNVYHLTCKEEAHIHQQVTPRTFSLMEQAYNPQQ